MKISQVHPKTQEVETVEFSPSYDLEPAQPTKLLAKHWTAVFVLNRVNWQKNVHLLLPPSHKPYWTQFEEVRKKDFKERGWEWKYSADPFATKKEREAIEIAKQKKVEQQKAAAAASATKVVTLDHAPPGGHKPRGWTQAPIVDLSRGTRKSIETLIQKYHSWNALGIEMSKQERDKTVKDLVALGFRKSHAEESCDWAKDKEEALEWLLIHVPEDDLPKIFLPEGHNTGVTIGGQLPIAQEYAARSECGTGRYFGKALMLVRTLGNRILPRSMS